MNQRQKQTYVCQFDLCKRSIFVRDWYTLHGVQRRVCTIDHFPEDCVLSVQMRLFCVRDKKLRFVTVGTRVSHCDNTACIKLKANRLSERVRPKKMML
jgi:hypothetical protein